MDRPLSTLPAVARKASRFNFLAAVLFLSLSLDYRAQAGGDLPQYIFTGCFVIAAVATLLYTRGAHYSRFAKQTRALFLLPVVLLPVTLMAYMLVVNPGSNDWPVAIHTYAAYFLLFLAFNAMYRIMMIVPLKICMRYFVAATIISTIWRFFYGLTTSGIDVDNVRYQILSPALPILLAYAIYSILSSERSTISSYALIAIAGVPMALSVTRTYLLTLGLTVAGIFVLYAACRSGKVLIRLVSIIVKFSLAAIVAGVITLAVSPNSVYRWVTRLSSDYVVTHTDITGEARVAQTKAVYRSLAEDPFYAMFGRELGSSFTMDPADLPHAHLITNKKAGRVLPQSDVLWATVAFNGGIVLLTGFVILFLSGIRRSFTLAREDLTRNPENPGLAVFTYIALVCLWSQSFTASETVAERLGPVMTAAIYALCVHLFDERSRQLAQARKRAALAPEPAPLRVVRSAGLEA